MIEVEITADMLLKARVKTSDMGRIHGSITRGRGTLAGFIGEAIAQQVLGAEETNTFQYDLTLPNGKTVDVKTKRTSVKPKPYYECSVSETRPQECDYYAFVRVKDDLTIGWYLGNKSSKEYLDKADRLEKGERYGDNNFLCRASCFNMAIDTLDAPTTLT